MPTKNRKSSTDPRDAAPPTLQWNPSTLCAKCSHLIDDHNRKLKYGKSAIPDACMKCECKHFQLAEAPRSEVTSKRVATAASHIMSHADTSLAGFRNHLSWLLTAIAAIQLDLKRLDEVVAAAKTCAASALTQAPDRRAASKVRQ